MSQIQADVALGVTAAGQALARRDEGQGRLGIVYPTRQQGGAAGTAITAAALEFHPLAMALQGIEQGLPRPGRQGTVPAMDEGGGPGLVLAPLSGLRRRQQALPHSSKSPRSS